jgi:P-type Cu2+ transporter
MTTISADDQGYEGLVKQSPDGFKTLSLLIGGVHCAACIQKIESAVLEQKDVVKARLNYSTGRLNIFWNGLPDIANALVRDVRALGYSVHPYNAALEKSAGDEENRFLLLCLGIAGFAMGNIMLVSVGLWTTDSQTMGMATRDFLHWVSALIAIPAVLFCGRPFFRSAYAALKNGHTNMDVPISVGLTLATGMSLFETIQSGEHVFFDSAVMLMFFLLIGRYLDFRARKIARGAAAALMQSLTGFASILDGDTIKRILIDDVREDMRLIVAMGEKIPIDGVVDDGHSMLDTSLITGETLPRPVKVGDSVYAGTINQSAPLIIRATKGIEQSLLADIARLMEDAQQSQSRYVRIADRLAKLYTPLVHILAASAFLLWWGVLGADWQISLMIAVAVLIITCPCALGLAVPVVQVLASNHLMRRGVLVKSGDALERLAAIDTVLFDKTGTLTHGTPALTGTYAPDDLKIAASLATASRHPLSVALATHLDGAPLKITNIQEHAGLGVEGVLNGQKLKIGSRFFCGLDDMYDSDSLEICFSINGQIKTIFTFDDLPREDAKKTIEDLGRQGLGSILLSGDRQKPVQKIADLIGIKSVFFQQTPVDKYAVLQNIKQSGHKVLMVGDGLNDAPVLAGADISMAPGTAIDMAQNAADIIFMGDQLKPIFESYKIAVISQKLVRQNFAIALIYNLFAIPLAFCGFITPMLAALAMSSSSLLVIFNSFRLKSPSWIS